jgi:hypothetical protein
LNTKQATPRFMRLSPPIMGGAHTMRASEFSGAQEEWPRRIDAPEDASGAA